MCKSSQVLLKQDPAEAGPGCGVRLCPSPLQRVVSPPKDERQTGLRTLAYRPAAGQPHTNLARLCEYFGELLSKGRTVLSQL